MFIIFKKKSDDDDLLLRKDEDEIEDDMDDEFTFDEDINDSPVQESVSSSTDLDSVQEEE